jgi:hypothetical protein
MLEPSNIPSQTRRLRGRPFEKGNKFGRGRTTGSRNNATIALQAMLDDEGKAITGKAVALALAGDPMALRLCVERLIPPARDRRIQLDLPDIVTAAAVADAMGATLKAVAAGEITPTEGQSVAGLLEIQRKALETADLERRVAALENPPGERNAGAHHGI